MIEAVDFREVSDGRSHNETDQPDEGNHHVNGRSSVLHLKRVHYSPVSAKKYQNSLTPPFSLTMRKTVGGPIYGPVDELFGKLCY